MPLDAAKKLLKEAGLNENEALWHHGQSGQWIMKHWAVERLAAHKKVTLDRPEIITSDPTNKTAVICVVGHYNDCTEWSIGEAAPYNTTQQYPFAMAEKRAKDRVVLKLLNLHGEVFSDQESDEWRDSWTGPVTKTKLQEAIAKYIKMMGAADSMEALTAIGDEIAYEARKGGKNQKEAVTYSQIIEQAEKDTPGWITGEGMEKLKLNGFVSFNDRMAEALDRLGANGQNDMSPERFLEAG